jgi:hypothetical protein
MHQARQRAIAARANDQQVKVLAELGELLARSDVCDSSLDPVQLGELS